MKKIVALFLVLIYISSIVGCNKAKYTVEIADNYPIANRLKTNYAAGEEVTVKLETITEHYYVLSVNGDEVEMDRDTSDLTYTYFTFTMPGEDVVIQIADKWVEIPPAPQPPVDQFSPIALTIAETLPSLVNFEYQDPNTPYCFYAYDADDNLYRVLWTDWEGLNEKDKIIVEYEKLEEYAMKLFLRGSEIAAQRGLILVDTKYEFGKINGEICLIDEIHTPDSSRYFYADGYQERFDRGEQQRQLSKEFVREWLMEHGFQGREGDVLPEMSDEFVATASDRYIELYEHITGEKFVRNQSENIESRIEENVKNMLARLL